MTIENSPENIKNSRSFYIASAAIVLLFISLAVWSALTTRPESDEGAFASPAVNLVQNGHFGTTVFEMEKSSLTRIDERTYWVMPLFLLNTAASFKIFGYSLFSQRAVSIFWGVVLLLAWYYIIFKFSEKRFYAAVCMALAGCSYVVLNTATIGRGDAMCASLGFASFAVYLALRERNLLLAVLLSQTLVVAAGLTHFLGILGFLGLLFLTFYYDFRSLGLKHLAVGAIPYLIGGAAFGLWVLQDPVAFKDQFYDNAVASGRMQGFSSPLDVILKEFTLRYPRAFGLMENTAGHSGPIYLKSLMLVGYALGVFGVLLNRELRKKFRVLLVLTFIYFFTLAFLDGQKLSVYLIYIVPFYLALLGIWFCALWEKGFLPRPLLALGLSGFLLLGIGGIALRCRQNVYAKYFQPTVEYLNQNAAESDLIIGGAELRFGLKRFDNHISDGAFGYFTGKRPTYIVYDPGVEDSWKDAKVFFPEFYEYLPKLLSQEYEVVYENTVYKIYKRR
jgi:4-amino-4-deoxy-L-arabinose transferase and related glycosyltransferases of PMT family